MRASMDFKMRLYRIDQMIKEQGPVKFDAIQKALNCSAPTLKRDLRYLREKLHAPIVYLAQEKGYVYLTDKRKTVIAPEQTFTLPATWYSPTEMCVLLSTLQMLDQVEREKDGLLFSEVKATKARLLSLVQDDKKQAPELLKRVKVVLPELKTYRNPFFEVIGGALTARKRLRIVYFSHARNAQSVREVSPLRLVNYRNRWYLDAWCHQMESLKTFNLNNVRQADLLPKACKIVAMRDVEAELDSGYGIFSGGVLRTAVIDVDPEMSVYVKDEIWHKDQKIVVLDNGHLQLYVPYSRETELCSRIMQYGCHAQVVSPTELRRYVKSELHATLALYDND